MTILFTRVKKVIDQLTDPQTHVVIPTIPGFGLSSPVEETGWQSVRTARAYAELMQRPGKERVKQMQAEWYDDMGYLRIQSTRPLTISYGLNGSPIAQLGGK